MKNDAYWKKFYESFNVNNPSDFAVFCQKFINKSDEVVDIGCGNGRDTYFLGRFCDNIIGIDANNRPYNYGNAHFIQRSVEDYRLGSFSVVYSRFFFHAIPEESQDIILNKCTNILLCEFRTDKGVAPSNDHYRRLINFDIFLSKLDAYGFDIIYSVEGKGMAVFKDEDPFVARIVAKKK